MASFRFALQPLLDERARDEQRAREALLRARSVYDRKRDASHGFAAAVAACDRAAFIALDASEAGSRARRGELCAVREAENQAKAAFAHAYRARMRLTILRERAYEEFLEEKERAELLELDEVNRKLRGTIG
jgi:flagellar biosynthesis chaperone FliJ